MYTIEQIIQALEALNATNTTESYVSNLANSGSEYASKLTNGGSPLLVYVPVATALACVIAIVIYFCTGSSNEDNEKTRKILERKQTGFFRPKRSESCVDRSQTRKLSKVECLKIMEVLANATDVVNPPADEVDEASEDQADDEELPLDVAETVLKQHFGRDEGIDSSSSSSSDKPVQPAEEEDGDNESTPTASGISDRSGSRNTEETERPKKPQHLITSGGEEEHPEESDDERLHYLDEYLGQDQNDEEDQTDQSIMSDDEGYTRPLGLGLGIDRDDSPASYATADTSTSRPRRSSWHGQGMA